MRIALIDGEPKSEQERTVSVYDRGFLYGDSVFETMRTYGGRVFALEEHLARLARSAASVFIALPVSLDALAAEVNRAVELAGNRESYVRLMVTRGTGPLGLDPDLAVRPLRVVLVEPLVSPPEEVYERGIEAILVRTARPTEGTTAAGAKIGNYLASILAIREAKQRGAAEALLVDARGRLVEGASSNLFVVSRGGLVTPPESAGILPGITRKFVLEAARALAMPCGEREIEPDDLFGADEAFVSSSIREILPIVRVDGRAIASGRPGPSTRALHAELRRLAQARTGALVPA